MSAENRTGRVYLELSETDKKDGVKLNTSRGTYTYDDKAASGSDIILQGVEFTVGSKTVKLDNWGKIWELVDTSKSTVKANNMTDAVLSIYDAKGRWVEDIVWSKTQSSTFDANVIADGYRVVISFLIDENKAGYEPGKGADGVDDRTQPIVTVVEQSKPGSSTYLHATHKFVVDNGDNVAKLVSEDKYDSEFPLWGEIYYDSKEDIDYIFAYEGDLTNVTKDVEVKANYVKDGKDVKRFGKVEAEEEKEYDELDANKDGVVSCEEALGKGWVWNNETSACELKGSSNTGSYVPNTATK